MGKKKWLILGCVLLTNGCVFRPAHNLSVDIPKKWPERYLFQTKSTTYLPELFWWQQLNNPELNGFIQKALKNNAQVHLAMTNIEYAQSQLEQVKFSWLPSLPALAGYSRFPVLGYPGTTFIANPTYIVNILQLYNQQKSAKFTLEATVYAKYCANLRVIANTAVSFFTLVAQKEALVFYENLYKDYQTYLNLLQRQYRSDLIALDEITQIQSQIQHIEAQIYMIKHNIVVSQNVLHFLCNENPGAMMIKTTFKKIDSHQLVPGNLPASVLKTRPDIRQAEAVLKASQADVDAITTVLLPSVTLGAYLGYGSDVSTIKLGQAYLNGPILDLPIFAQIKSNKARYQSKYIEYITTIRAALRDVSNDLSAYSAYDEQLKKNRAALEQEKHACHLSQVRYRYGLEDKVKFIQCKIRVDEFKLLVNKNKLEKMIALVTLYQDMGGGYHGY